jgi:hypothetical protein
VFPPPIALLAMVFVVQSLVSAHDLSRSESRLEIHGREVRVLFTIDLLELSDVDRNRDGRVSYDELDASIERIFAAVKENYQVRAAAPPLHISVEQYGIIDGHVLRMELNETFAEDVSRLEITSTLDRIARSGHQHLASATVDGIVHQAVLDASMPTAVFSAAGHPYLKTFGSFLGLGIEHIFTGYDHLAFLVCLLIAATTLRSLVTVITSFTVAHSVTLALATFDLVIVPTRLTESLIALSIGYVAIENLLEIRAIERYRITFLFGLVHGFGFSNVLREMQLPRASLALSLFSFNAGVELGQLAFVVAVFPLMGYTASRRWRQLRPAVSLAVVFMSVYWFLQRAFVR